MQRLWATVLLAAVAGPLPLAWSQAPEPQGADDAEPEQRGLLCHEPEALEGYTLIAPLRSKSVYLVNMKGEVVHHWETDHGPGSEYLLDNGNLLRCSRELNPPRFKGGGQGGRLQEIAWDGSIVWDYRFADEDHLQHHDIAPTPDGTILMIAWEYKDQNQAIEAGRDPSAAGRGGMWPDFVVEIDPIRPEDGEIIWEWHVWDHLIQDVDPKMDHFGSVAEDPGRIDINCDVVREMSAEEIEQLQALGYIDTDTSPADMDPDWLHTNGIDYNPELDQIVLSVPRLSEVWIIDHSSTSDEAMGDEGGLTGKGGRLLFRWGNPGTYRAGESSDQALFFQHDSRWVPAGFPGAGHLMIFNNGGGRPDGDYSSILELKLPLTEDGNYQRSSGQPFGPQQPTWEYIDRDRFYSSFISGAQRLRNGNTLICQGASGRVFEVTPGGKIVWDFLHELGAENPTRDADGAPMQGLFRATRIPHDHPAVRGKTLHPLPRAGS